MSSIWLPDTLYRSLPVVYGIAGLSLLMLLRGNPIAALSALLLITASVLVSLWRFRHRSVRSNSSTSALAREAFYRRKRRLSSADIVSF